LIKEDSVFNHLSTLIMGATRSRVRARSRVRVRVRELLKEDMRKFFIRAISVIRG